MAQWIRRVSPKEEIASSSLATGSVRRVVNEPWDPNMETERRLPTNVSVLSVVWTYEMNVVQDWRFDTRRFSGVVKASAC